MSERLAGLIWKYESNMLVLSIKLLQILFCPHSFTLMSFLQIGPFLVFVWNGTGEYRRDFYFANRSFIWDKFP